MITVKLFYLKPIIFVVNCKITEVTFTFKESSLLGVC